MNTEPVIIQVPVRVRMTPEEAAADLEARYPNRPICCFCGEKVKCPYGNSPAPVAKKGKCCGDCNTTVVFARMGVLSVEEAKSTLREHKKQKKQKEEEDAFFAVIDRINEE